MGRHAREYLLPGTLDTPQTAEPISRNIICNVHFTTLTFHFHLTNELHLTYRAPVGQYGDIELDQY